MYSVTDEAGSIGGEAMATGGFEKAKLSRSQLEQRSIVQLQEQVQSMQEDPAILADQNTDNGDIQMSTVR